MKILKGMGNVLKPCLGWCQKRKREIVQPLNESNTQDQNSFSRIQPHPNSQEIVTKLHKSITKIKNSNQLYKKEEIHINLEKQNENENIQNNDNENIKGIPLESLNARQDSQYFSQNKYKYEDYNLQEVKNYGDPKKEEDTLDRNSPQILKLSTKSNSQESNKYDRNATSFKDKQQVKKTRGNKSQSFNQTQKDKENRLSQSYHHQISNEEYQKEVKVQQFLLPKGLPNLGNTCYINSALQTLRQISTMHNKFLNQHDSQFALFLQEFFKNLNERQLKIQELQELVDISKNMQAHFSTGGDSYTTLISFLGLIISQKELSKHQSDLSNFQKIFTVTQCDGVQCTECQSYCQSDECECPYFEEQLTGLQVQNFEDIFTSNSMYNYLPFIEMACSKCNNQTQFIPKRITTSYPLFLFIHLSQNNLSSNNKQEQIQFQQNNTNIIYKLIGVCNYYGYHYTYTALQLNKWIYFSDQHVSESSLDLDSAIYLLYVQCNQY